MPENDLEFKKNVKEAFSKVKEDINNIKSDLNSNKNDLNEVKHFIAGLNEKIGILNDFIQKEARNGHIFFKNSTGNKGVFNDQQRSTTMNNNEQQSTAMPNNTQQFPTTTNNQQPSTTYEVIKGLLDPNFIQKIQGLTDREFSLFIKIYELNCIKEEISYSELARHLKLTEGTIRGVVTQVISKGLPLIKERFFNRKSSLFIDPAFFNPPLLPELMKLRSSPMQKTLEDKF